MISAPVAEKRSNCQLAAVQKRSRSSESHVQSKWAARRAVRTAPPLPDRSISAHDDGTDDNREAGMNGDIQTITRSAPHEEDIDADSTSSTTAAPPRWYSVAASG